MDRILLRFLSAGLFLLPFKISEEKGKEELTWDWKSTWIETSKTQLQHEGLQNADTYILATLKKTV